VANDQDSQQGSQQKQTPGDSSNTAPVAVPVAAQNQTTPESTTAAVSPLATPANDVTSSKTGGDTRRSRDEAGAAEQPSRLAPAVDQQAAPTVAVQDQPSAKDVAATTASPAATPQAPVRLAELAQAAQTAIKVTSQNGGASARITLHPNDLGSVDIHLRYGVDGVTATVRADSPQAAQILHDAAPDLKRALEGQGMSLLGFDVRDRSGQPAGGNPSNGQGQGNAAGGSNDADPDDEITGLTGPAVETALDPWRLPAPGSQIDVLA
jgi:flagellar hook-length control protein FliK